MAALRFPTFTFLAVTLLGEGLAVTDEEFQVSYITLHASRYKSCHIKCCKARLVQPYVDSF